MLGIPENSSTTPSAVVFDLGGVVVRICHTWQEALRVAGVSSHLLDAPDMSLMTLDEFDLYQSDEVTFEEYIRALARFVDCTPEEAVKTHLSILIEPYPGIAELIDGLNAAGLKTGCLSNTNAPHWHVMTETAPFAPVARLQMRLGSHEIGLAKPDPDAFLAYADKFNLRPEEIIYFDDNRANVMTSTMLGWDAHQVDPAGDTPTQMRNILRERLSVALTCG